MHIFTGSLRPGVCPIQKFEHGGAEAINSVWLWHHFVADGAGHGAQHFSLVLQVPGQVLLATIHTVQ